MTNNGRYESHATELEPSYDVVSFLQRAGERYKEHLELLKRQRAEENKRIAPGKPVISPYATEWFQQTTRKNDPVENRLHRLHQQSKANKEAARTAHAAQVREQDQKSMKKPKLTQMAQERGHRDPAEVSKKWLEDRNHNLHRLAENNVRRELETLQDGPGLTAMALTPKIAERRQGRPIEEHLIAKEAARRERLYQQYDEEQRKPVGVFRPAITPHEAHRNIQGSHVIDRLYTPNPNPPAAYDETFERECRFQPSVNHSFSYVDPCADVNVFDRLHDNLPRSVAESKGTPHRGQAARDTLQQHTTFTPRISDRSRQIVENRRSSGAAFDQRSPTTKLYEQRTASVSQHYSVESGATPSTVKGDPSHSFTPSINDRSRALWRRLETSISKSCSGSQKNEKLSAREIYWQKRKDIANAEKLRKKHDAEAEKMKECTFQPEPYAAQQRNSSSVRRERDHLDFVEREMLWAAQRKAAVEQRETELNAEELEGCTFHPAVLQEYPVPLPMQSNAAGFEYHVHRMEESRQRKMEIEKPRRARRAGPTVPVPFKLGPERDQHLQDRDGGMRGGNISSLRPPINHYEWNMVRSSLDEDDFYNHYGDGDPSQPQQQQQYGERYEVPASRTTGQKAAGGAAAGMTVSPSMDPVDYIISNHQSILRSLNHQQQPPQSRW